MRAEVSVNTPCRCHVFLILVLLLAPRTPMSPRLVMPVSRDWAQR
jgi:hypothetical protein